MTDSHGKPLFPDDPALDARLNALDRGLAGSEDDSAEAAARRRTKAFADADPAIWDGPLSASRRAAFRDEDVSDASARAERRALHDLFPSSEELGLRPPGPSGGERPPGPLIGTAVGPRLSDRRVPADVAPASVADGSADDIDFILPARDIEISVMLPRMLTAFVLAALTLAGAAAAAWVFRDAVARTIQQWQRVPAPPAEPTRQVPAPLTPTPPSNDHSRALDNPAPPARV